MSCVRSFFPRHSSDIFAFCMMLVCLHIVGFYELLVILPYIDSERNKTFWFHVVCGLFVYFNVITSFFLLSTTNSTTARHILPSILKPGWRYCSECQTNSPPRSSHCWLCNSCVLRRDHHCMFSGSCVGHQNQRYFLTLLFYLTVGSIYCNYLNFDYTFEILGGFSWRSVLTMILPLLSWTIGIAGTVTFAVSFVSAMCIVSLFLFIILMFYHGRNVFYGQTCNERNRGINDYNYGWKTNIRIVLGERWYCSWLCPLITSPPLGDGFEFKSRYQFEDIKEM